MSWSFRLGRLFGVPVYLHFTFLLLLGLVALVGLVRGGFAAALAGTLMIASVFACVLLHEFGHILAARRYGIPTQDVILLPIGGLARLARMPDEPRQELVVALAGPAVNVAIAAALFPVVSLGASPFLAQLFAINLILAAFNMLPAFPMDGGRVLRALLATRMEYTQATQIAASTGQGIALLFGVLGLFVFGNPVLLFIALFVWIGAAQEASMVQMKSALSGIPVRRAMLTDFRVLGPANSLGQAVQLTLDTSQRDFAVVEEGRVVGILTQSDLLAALSSSGSATPVGEVMQRDFVVVDANDMLETAFARFSECSCKTLPVVQHGQLVGMVTMDNVGEFLAIHGALKRVRGPRRA